MTSMSFGIEPKELMKIMSNYKSRTSEREDLKYFEQNSISDILSKLKTDPEKGISSKENRKEFFGSNKIFNEDPPSFFSFVWGSVKDLMIRILLVAAIVSIILGCTISVNKTDWIDGVSILVAILIVVLVSSITEYSKELKFHELNKTKNQQTKYKIIRKGQPDEYMSDDILVGDLIIINYGDIMSSDILLIEGSGIKMDESTLTGESETMVKEPYEKCMKLFNNSFQKDEIPSPLILSGTNCIAGSGKGIVLAVGEHSQKGIIQRTIDNAKEDCKTPLEIKLDKIARVIGYIGLSVGIITFIVFFIRYMVEFAYENKRYKELKEKGTNNITNPKDFLAKDILNIIMLSISIIVVAVPEGLPLAVTLSLAFSIRKLMEYNNLIRKMHACETMGGANYICTDKTGTLTKNELSVFEILTGKDNFELIQNREIDDVGKVNRRKSEQFKQIREDHNNFFPNEYYWNLIKIAIALNVECSIKKNVTPDINGDMEICETKNKTDKPFIDFLYRFKSPISTEREKYLTDDNLYKQFPFDSQKKRMTTFIQNPDFPTGYRLFTKGSGENSLLYCKSYIEPETGNCEPLNASISYHIRDKLEEFSKNRLRSLYIAYKDITEEEYNNAEKKNLDGKLIDQYDLVFLCVFGIKDSLRDGVKEAVKKCNEASVNVIMVTGDNIITATSIAKDCGILGDEIDLKNLEENGIEKHPEKMYENPSKKEEYIEQLLNNRPYALTGASFYQIIGGLFCENCKKETRECTCPKTETEAAIIAKTKKTEIQKVKKDKIRNMNNFLKIIKRLKVLARSEPLHKYALVLGLKDINNVVAVTGDGTNDAPALSKSDVGFAMFAGTDVAKEASDIIILDNDFSSIVTAIIYGRNIYDNIRKFLQFQLSVNFCACIVVFICACLGNETPLTPIQMLWVNLIMDSLGSLALSTEPPYDELLKRKPTKKNEFIINGKICKHIAFQSIALILLLVLLYNFAPSFIKEDNLKIVSENYKIRYCYGEENYPGKDIRYIINGMEAKWKDDIEINTSVKDSEDCNEYINKQTLNLAYNKYIEMNSGTTHMSIIFNIFVLYILFNQINCRIIDDSFNIFKYMERNIYFIIIIILEICLQVIIIFFGNSAFHIIKGGLSGRQWGICIGFSAITFVVSIIAKSIKLDIFLDKYLSPKEKEPNIDPIAPEIKIAQINDINNIDTNKGFDIKEEDEEDIISEKVNINMLKYDFENAGKNILLDANKKHDEKVSIISKDSTEEKENNFKNKENSVNKKEETSKKYKITNLGRNIMKLPENYSTDDEDEYKFINLMNEQNDSYELSTDSKIIKIYSKMVSKNNNIYYILFII